MSDELIQMAEANGGYLSSAKVTGAGIPRRRLSEAVGEDAIVRVGRGLYALPAVWEDPYYLVQHRFSRGTFSDGTALFLHDLTDRPPLTLTMTFPRSYNAGNAKRAGVTCRSCADDVLGLGVTELTTPFGNPVRAYDAERSLCDLLRGHATPDVQLFAPAMRTYLGRRGRDPVKLMDYARALGVERKIRPYLEALL